MFVGLLAVFGCNAPPPPPPVPGVIADHGAKVFTVNGTEVGTRELDLVYTLMKVPPPQFETFRKSGEGRHVNEEYAAATVLYEMAIEQKLHEDPQIALELAFTARQILGARMRTKLSKDAVTDEKIQKWYEDNKAQFVRPEARVRQILVADQVLANDLLARLQNGEDFGKLAADHSIDTQSKDRGGELGWIRLDDPTIGAALKAAEPNRVVGPHESRFGFHLLEVHEKRDLTPLEDVRDAASAQIATEEARKQVDEIRKSMKIEWVDPPTEPAKPVPGGASALPSNAPPADRQPPGGDGMPSGHPGGGGGPGMPPNHPAGNGMPANHP